jgi:uncharacterized oxidoreductase
MQLTGRTILLTGGGSGIGRELATQLANKGNSVLICGRRLEALEETATHSDGIHPYRCDLTSSDDIQGMLDAIEGDGHRIDMLINNAAIFAFQSLSDGLDLELTKQIVDANLSAPIELTQKLLDRLRAAADPTIVIVGSPGGLGPLAQTPIYSSSKAGLHAYALCLRHHLDGEVRVIEAFPPTVDTPMLAEKKWKKKMSSEECARRMLRGIEREQEEIWIGESQMFRILHRVLSPKRLFRVINDWDPPEHE